MNSFDNEQDWPPVPQGEPIFYTPPPETLYPLKRYPITLDYSQEEFKEIIDNINNGVNESYDWNYILNNNELSIWRIGANGIWIKIPFKQSGDRMITNEVFAYPDMFVDMWGEESASKKIFEKELGRLIRQRINGLLGIPPKLL